MRIQRFFSLLLTIGDFSTLEVSDIDAMLLDLVRGKYEKVCYKGAFIHTVDRLVYRSGISLNQGDLSMSYNVSVCVEASVERYTMGETIVDMEVVRRNAYVITLKKAHILALMKVNASNELYEVGSKLPITVRSTIMDIGQQMIKVNAVAFTPTNNDIQYLVSTGADQPELNNELKNLMTIRDSLVESISGIPKRELDEIIKWLYPSKEAYIASSPKTIDYQSILSSDKEIYVLYSDAQAFSRNYKETHVELLASPKGTFVKKHKQLVVCDFLERDCKILSTIVEVWERKLIENTDIVNMYSSLKK